MKAVSLCQRGNLTEKIIVASMVELLLFFCFVLFFGVSLDYSHDYRLWLCWYQTERERYTDIPGFYLFTGNVYFHVHCTCSLLAMCMLTDPQGHFGDEKMSQAVFLPLAERMVEKMVGENKVESEAGTPGCTYCRCHYYPWVTHSPARFLAVNIWATGSKHQISCELS